MFMFKFWRFVLILLLLICAGCSSFLQLTDTLPMFREISPLPQQNNCRIAVLPFLNDSEYPQGGVFVQKVFAAQLLNSGKYQLAPEGDIGNAYSLFHLLPGDQPTLEQLRIVADRVNAPLLLTGIIFEMQEGRSDHQTINPQLVMQVELRSPDSGEILWTTFHRRKGTDYKKTMHFGTLHTMTGLCRQMAEEIINLWHEKGFSQCNE